MNELDLLRQLGQRARAENTPPVDVAGRIVSRIAQRPARMVDRRLALVAACACSLSAAALFWTWSAPAHDSMAALTEVAYNSTGPDALLKLFEP